MLQTKIWQPGEARNGRRIFKQQLREVRKSLKNRIWNPGGSKSLRFVVVALLQKSKGDQIYNYIMGVKVKESMKNFYMGSLMKEHPGQMSLVIWET